MRLVAMKLWACVVIFVVTVHVGLGSSPAASQNVFYQASENDIAGPIGSLIREEPHFAGRADPNDC